MADRVKGIVVEIGGDTTGLDKALKGTNKNIGSTQKSLKDVERLLKLDPTNTKLLEQKQRLLAEAVTETREKLDTLKKANEQVAKSVENYDTWKAAYDPIQAEISTTQKALKDLKDKQKELADCGEVDTDAYRKLQTEVEESSRKLRELKAQATEVSKEFGNPISVEQYDSLQREIAETEASLKNLEDQSKKFGSVATQQAAQVAEKFDEVGKKIGNAGEKVTDAGKKLLPATGAVIAGGTACVTTADSLKSAINSFLTSTGTAAEGFEELSDGTVAAVDNTEKYKDILEAIYAGNYGEGFDDIAASMATVKTVLNDLDDSQLQGVTESAILLRDTFGFDVTESVRAANSLMDQFGITADEAFNLMAQGAQKGLNQNGDLMDVINEYSVQFKSIGYGADDMFNMLANGAKNGTWSVDKLGDAVKEFNIRISDGSAKDAVEALGYSWEKVSEDWAKGGNSAKDVLFMLMDNLSGLDDQTERYNTGVRLLGTMFEDLGYDAIMALSDTSGEITKTSDAMNSIKTQKFDDLGNKMERLGKMAVSDIAIPLGETLIPVIADIIDCVTEWIGKFGELDPAAQIVVMAIAAVVAGIGPALIAIGNVITGVSKITTASGAVIKFLPNVSTAFKNMSTFISTAFQNCVGFLTGTVLPAMQTAFTSVFSFIAANPVVLLIGAIVGLVALIATKGDEIRAILTRVDAWLQNVFATDWSQLFGPVLGGILNGFFATVKSIWDGIKQVLNGIIDFIRGVFTGDWQRAWSGLVSIFNGIFSGLVNCAKKPINAIIKLVNGAIDGINSAINKVNKIPGVKLGTIGKIPMLASGGTVYSGNAIVGEAGPELLTVSGGRAIVRPLSNSTTTTNNTAHLGQVVVNVYAQSGQDEYEIAMKAIEIMGDEVARKAAIFGV